MIRLQQLVIENERFTTFGFRTSRGFTGEHDRTSGTLIPGHISARWEDLDLLTEGLIRMKSKLQTPVYDAVLAAATIVFGFVFIHPFIDGNGRIHRYLIHHVLTRMGFSPEGLLFPVSSAILDRIHEYRKVLEVFSHPRLDLIKWKPTRENNVEILNQTSIYTVILTQPNWQSFFSVVLNKRSMRLLPEKLNICISMTG